MSSSTSIQKKWMKDLPQPVVILAKKKAVEATAAWNDTVAGTLKAAKAIYEVREKIGAKGSGSFSAWAVEELQRSHQTASALATVGSRYDQFANALANLPPSWGTLYELAKAPDDVFRRALRRTRPDMERNEVTCLLLEETSDKAEPQKMRGKKKGKQKKESRALQVTPKSPAPREAANTTIMAGSVWRTVKDFAERVDTALETGALSPEAKNFMVNNYITPSIDLLRKILERVVAPVAAVAELPKESKESAKSVHSAKFQVQPDRTWQWACTCGSTGGASSREGARSQFKSHRSI